MGVVVPRAPLVNIFRNHHWWELIVSEGVLKGANSRIYKRLQTVDLKSCVIAALNNTHYIALQVNEDVFQPNNSTASAVVTL